MLTKAQIRELPRGFHPFPGMNRKQRRQGVQNKSETGNNSRPHQGRSIRRQLIEYPVAVMKNGDEHNMKLIDGVLTPVKTTFFYEKNKKNKKQGFKDPGRTKVVKTTAVKGEIAQVVTRKKTICHEQRLGLRENMLHQMMKGGLHG